MGIRDAVIASSMLKAKHIIPIHYNTWDIISVDPQEFITLLSHNNMQGLLIRPGEFIEY